MFHGHGSNQYKFLAIKFYVLHTIWLLLLDGSMPHGIKLPNFAKNPG